MIDGVVHTFWRGMKEEFFNDLFIYAMGSMIFADILMFGFIVMFALFGHKGWPF